ncbi:S6 family peptidase [Escherichia coli]|uniref:S6 family peptidase n=1 Tax=Escherichia coli TaxID=562 RepID=UPI0023E89D26|nr:S6 family peptidase [Escherichia coli]MDF3971405.1 S6 family peptidase [Escherichia coli]
MTLIIGGYLYISPHTAYCSTVSAEISYQTFRDFAENKGQFSPGSLNLNIYDKHGALVGTLDKAPMIDFSSTDLLGISTLIHPQYLSSVKHNIGYKSVSFGNGQNKYNIVDRNNHSGLDFHAPRLDKLVTEVTPATLTQQGPVSGVYANKNRYPVFYRMGSGTQYIKDKNGKLTRISGAYQFVTGGTVGSPNSYQNGQMITSRPGDTFNPQHGPLASYGQAGDSGSPLYAFDTLLNKWVIVGVLTAGNGVAGPGNNWAVMPTNWIKDTINSDFDQPINITDKNVPVIWTFNQSLGTGSLSHDGISFEMHGKKGNDLNHGKNLLFSGNEAKITLDSDVDQGAGYLQFNGHFSVASPDHHSWKGAGIIVDKDSDVIWKVKGVKGDNLHKIGEGTLVINGTGINDGGLKVGDGTVILNQEADSNGYVQAFSSIELSSGRPTVVLTNEKQINPDSIFWGYRGGNLDLNGNNITFTRLNADDYGAKIINNSNKTSTLNISRPDSNLSIFHGVISGNINVNIDGKNTNGSDFFDGSIYLPYTKLTKNGGELTFQGHPVIHASVNGSDPVSLTQNDWERRDYTIDSLYIYNTEFNVSRDASVYSTVHSFNSDTVIGSDNVAIDKNEGKGTHPNIVTGKSIASDNNKSNFKGQVFLYGSSSLTIKDNFEGGIFALGNGTVKIQSGKAILNQYSHILGYANLSVEDNGELIAYKGLQSANPIKLNDSKVTLSGSGTNELYNISEINLNGSGSTLSVENGAYLLSKIKSDSSSTVSFNSDCKSYCDDKRYATNWLGSIDGNNITLTMNNNNWLANHNSSVSSASINNSVIDMSSYNVTFKTSKFNKLDIFKSSFILNTNLKSSDNIIVRDQLKGNDNKIFVKPLIEPNSVENLNIPLIIAPKNTDSNLFNICPLSSGFHTVTPLVDVRESDKTKDWLLKGFSISENNSNTKQGKVVGDNSLRAFSVELNNMYKRMGELRNNTENFGAWTRIMNSHGSENSEFKDKYTHLQLGVDIKSNHRDYDKYTGLFISHTNLNGSNSMVNSDTKSYGVGFYSSVLFNNGAYFDIIGKYVHHKNSYSSGFLSFDDKKNSNYSLYGGIEVGHRSYLKDDYYIEPQAELTYGYISSQSITLWNNPNQTGSIIKESSAPLVGRVGVIAGKQISNEKFDFGFHLGSSYQMDLRNDSNTILKDSYGKFKYKREKDERLIFNAGLNMVNNNIRFGVEAEKSILGNYNIDHSINANFRYSF